MPLNPKLTKFTTASPVIASYNFTDIAEGTGTVRYFLMNSKDSVGVDYHLTANTVFSRDINTQHATGADLDFDLSAYNFPQTLKGTGLANISIKLNVGGSNVFATCKIIKWDGASETDLVTFITETYNTASGFVVLTVPFVIPKTQFKKGDVLRLNIVWTIGGGTIELGNDPKDGTLESARTTASFIDVPFELNL